MGSENLTPVRRAEWTPKRIRDPLTRRRHLLADWLKHATLGLAIAALVGGVWLSIRTSFGVLIMNVISMGTTASLTWVRQRRAESRILDLMDLPSLVPQFPVRLACAIDGLSFAEDQGVVTLTDGWLQYHGERATFGFPASEKTHVCWHEQPGLRGPKAAPVAIVVLSDGGWEHVLRFEPFDGYTWGGHRETGLKLRFGRALRAWVEEPSGARGGELLPPDRPQAHCFARTKFQRIFGNLLIAGTPIGLIIFAVFGVSVIGVLAIVLGGFATFLGLIVRIAAIQTETALRRLAAGEPFEDLQARDVSHIHLRDLPRLTRQTWRGQA